jgi:hypothetical protein
MNEYPFKREVPTAVKTLDAKGAEKLREAANKAPDVKKKFKAEHRAREFRQVGCNQAVFGHNPKSYPDTEREIAAAVHGIRIPVTTPSRVDKI